MNIPSGQTGDGDTEGVIDTLPDAEGVSESLPDQLSEGVSLLEPEGVIESLAENELVHDADPVADGVSDTEGVSV